MRLEGKVALITGATKGTGAGMARRFAQEGAKVAVIGRSDSGQDVADTIGENAIFVRTDVADEEAVKAAVAATVEAFGGLHVLVNNAGPMDEVLGGGDQPLVGQPTEAWDEVVKIALYGTMWFCKYSLPHMIEAGGGSIMSSSSINSIVGQPSMPSYSAAKGAINALSRQLAVDYGAQGVRVNSIIWGPLDNERLDTVPIPGLREIFRAQQLVAMPTPDDCASAAIFLASDESRCITGQTLVVDGGYLINGRLPLDDVVDAGLASQEEATGGAG